MGRVRRDHQDIGGLVDAGGEQRGMRAQVADDHRHLRGDQLARRLDRFLQTAGVVDLDQGHLVAEHAAVLIELADRHFDRDPIARAGQRVGSAQRIGEADLDLGLGIARCSERQRADQQVDEVPAHNRSPRAARPTEQLFSSVRQDHGGKLCNPLCRLRAAQRRGLCSASQSAAKMPAIFHQVRRAGARSRVAAGLRGGAAIDGRPLALLRGRRARPARLSCGRRRPRSGRCRPHRDSCRTAPR